MILINAERHIQTRDLLNQALNGNLAQMQSDLENLFKKYNIDSMPGLSKDACCYVIEDLYLKRLDLSVY